MLACRHSEGVEFGLFQAFYESTPTLTPPWIVPCPDEKGGGLTPPRKKTKTTRYKNIDNRIYEENLPGKGRDIIVTQCGESRSLGQKNLEDCGQRPMSQEGRWE